LTDIQQFYKLTQVSQNKGILKKKQKNKEKPKKWKKEGK
jgi:hypothetical protein